MLRRVYIETTVPSFYHEVRPEPDMVAKRELTRQWWDGERGRYDVVTSIPVLEELGEGEYPAKGEALPRRPDDQRSRPTGKLVEGLPVLPVGEDIYEAVETYIEQGVMPSDPRGDALHLALASYHRCHFLLTWNCAHLANANKFEHIRYVNAQLGLQTPAIITPEQLLHWEE